MGNMSDGGDNLGGLALLAEPLRRRLYLHVLARPEPVGRDEAAAALGVARSVAAFHLDKLAEAGLLEVEFRRPPGRSGPGAGRPAKRYRPAAAETAFSAPERHYDLAARLLAEAVAVASARGTAAEAELVPVARTYGREVGAASAAGDGPSAVERLVTLLRAQGYEPHMDNGVVTFENCPFHRLATDHPELVCGMNLEIAAGILEGAGMDGDRARLDPAPGRCCVTIAAGRPS